MFLEQKQSGLYLGKKSSGKTFLVKVGSGGITEDILLQLTKKEVLYIQTTAGYLHFASQVFDTSSLEYVLFHSKFLFNNMDVCDLIEKRIRGLAGKAIGKKLTDEEILYKQGKFIEKWLKNQFPKTFIYNSNNIEGSRISPEEVEKIIEEKKYTHKIQNEVLEVQNSFCAWNFLQTDFIFNTAHIKKIYHILTKNLVQETGAVYPRGFKKVANIAGINSQTTSPEMVELEIKKLLEHYKNTKKDTFSLQSAFDFHLKYEQIHPFENGNGRTGRLIMEKILIQFDMVPMIVFTENKKSYSNAIASCSSGRKKKYYKFMLQQYKKTLEISYDVFPGKFKALNTNFMQLEIYLGKQL